MAIPFITGEGVFTRWGAEIASDNMLNTDRGANTNTRVELVNSMYISTDQDLIDGLYSARDAFRTTGNQFSTYWQALMQATLQQMADDDQPLAPYDLPTAIDRLNADLLAAGSGIEAPTITLSVTADPDNYGDAVLIVSKYQGDGHQADYIFSEEVVVTVTNDAQRGATEYREPIQYVGELSVGVRQWDWPKGSGTSLASNITDADQTTLISNGGFETWDNPTTAMASDWDIETGAINVTIKRNGSVKVRGNYSCEFASAGAELGISQTIDPDPSTVYPVNLWISLSAAAAAGVLQVSLVDQTDTIIEDEQGVQNVFTQDLTSVSVPTDGTFLAINEFFRTPKTVPAVVKLLIRTSTPLTTGRSLYIDLVANVQATRLYNGGFFAACFSGGTGSQIDDFWTITATNSKTVTSFARSLDRNLGLRDLDKRIETGGGISDALIV